MKTLFRISTLATLALSAFASGAHAQAAKSLGILAGVDFSNYTGLPSGGNSSSLTGFVGGLYVGIPVGDRVAVEPNVLYAGKGARDDDFDIDVRTGYIEIPVLLRYNFNNSGGPFLLAGPAIGFNISCSLSDGTTSISCSDFGAEANTTVGAVLGLGFQQQRFGLEGRYDFDFGNAFKDGQGKNAVWEIIARVMLK